MPNLHSKEILSQIGSNQIVVINIYDLSKELYSGLITSMDTQGCRLSEADFSDLTYYSHLFELFWWGAYG